MSTEYSTDRLQLVTLSARISSTNSIVAVSLDVAGRTGGYYYNEQIGRYEKSFESCWNRNMGAVLEPGQVGYLYGKPEMYTTISHEETRTWSNESNTPVSKVVSGVTTSVVVGVPIDEYMESMQVDFMGVVQTLICGELSYAWERGSLTQETAEHLYDVLSSKLHKLNWNIPV